jgi:cytochrome c553
MKYAQGLRKFFYILLGGVVVLPAAALDLERAKEIYGPCAACHGPFGAGGKQGEYPRIAGQSPKYVEQQLQAFQSQLRINLPMYPYTRARELDNEDMKLLAAYLAQIELPTRPPVFKDSDDALARLLAMEKVMIVPRAAGNIENGKAVYQKNCAVCHGKTGQGRGMFPMLVGQYTNYLQKQIAAYLEADRPHDEEGAKTGVLYTLKAGDIQDVLAYLTTLQVAEQ